MSVYDLQTRSQRRPSRPTPPAARPTGNSFTRGLVTGLLAFLLLVVLGSSAALIGYALIASSLPAVDELAAKFSTTFQSTRITDRNGNLLYETLDPNAGRRTRVPLDQIDVDLRNATIATEDANFYEHQGVDPVALARALYYAVQEGEVVSGGSTITQQVVKRLLLTPEQTVTRKVKEAILAAEISRNAEYSKDKILEIYLNDIFYGNLAYGAEAAAKTYFGKSVSDLTLGEASLLAGLPQAPAYYDPYNHPDRAKKRQGVVLGLMVEAGYISKEEADAAWRIEPVYKPLENKIEAPHFTLFVYQQLEALLGTDFATQGYQVKTALDMQLQATAQQIVSEQVAAVAAEHNVTNGALVAMRPQTGEILALVGSADYNNVEIDGQINMALAPRQPGSTIKPLVYLAAFEQPNRPAAERWTPGTLVADIKESFPDGANPPYVPTNYDNKENGLLTVRSALGRSLNIPAVRALQTVGLPAFLATTQRLGITTLTRPDYGLSLALGAGEIPLVEMTGAFAIFANQGIRMPPLTIQEIIRPDGSVYCSLTTTPCYPPGTPVGQPAISAVDAFLITDILSDNNARTPTFGENSLLRLDRPAAAKTGTTNDFRDVLTLGYTPQLVTGVWVGNADNSEMINISGITGAAPIWNRFMNSALALENAPVQEFTPPPGVRQFEVCAETGTQPSEACPERRTRWYAEDRPPLPKEQDLYQKIRLDKASGKLATENTPPEMVEEKIFKVYPAQYRQWASDHGIPQPPQDPSDVFDRQPEVRLSSPAEGEVLDGIVTVRGSADAAAFARYELQYGISHEPGAFSAPFAGNNGPLIDTELGQWDTRGLENGPHTLRLVVRDTFGNEYENRVRVYIEHGTPTDVPTLTPTWTPEVVDTPTETLVPLPADTPVVVEPPTNTPEPTVAPPVDTPVEIPTDTPVPPAETPTLESSQPITSAAVITDAVPITATVVITTPVGN